MITRHLRDRFFQRYGVELNGDIMRQLLALCRSTKGTPNSRPGAEEVAFIWNGHHVRAVWDRKAHFIYTFLPEPGMRIAWQVGKARRR